MKQTADDIRWGLLIHFGAHMWYDMVCFPEREKKGICGGLHDHHFFDYGVWCDWTQAMAKSGVNTLVVDVGEGVVYPSHPELGIKGSWSADRLHAEVARLKKLGLEVIPKLNFSTTHDAWLGEYGHMVSTPEYYKVRDDVIGDLAEIFEKPKLFHLGMDEETAWHQPPGKQNYACLRQGELWWHDIELLFRRVEALGMRPWIWSDYIWHHKELFLARMPKTVLQSNWYYGEKIDPKLHTNENARLYTGAFQWLEDAGYDQIPCGSTWSTDKNFPAIVEWGRTHVPPARLKGFLMTTWALTVPQQRANGLKAIKIVADARADFERADRRSAQFRTRSPSLA